MDLNGLSQKFKRASGLNFAAIRLPDTNDIYFFYATRSPHMRRLDMQESAKPLFVCSPYGAGNMAYVLDADLIYKNDELLYGNGSFPDQSSPSVFSQAVSNYCADESFYINYVNQSVEEIKKDRLDKTVAARCKQITLGDQFDHASFFHRLLQRYPSACIYYFSFNGVGFWVGATPERLLTVKNGVLQTVALAGTLPIDSQEDWTQKEQDEQSITENFIEQVFEEQKISDYKKSPVTTITAGNLRHLSSTFTWKPEPELLQKKFHKLLNTLNPTPAVCGMPQFDATLFIAQHEKMERRFYTGFIGVLNHTLDTNLYVNLRCMELSGKQALLYAGAGITQDSIGEREWQETERKMETLSSLIN